MATAILNHEDMITKHFHTNQIAWRSAAMGMLLLGLSYWQACSPPSNEGRKKELLTPLLPAKKAEKAEKIVTNWMPSMPSITCNCGISLAAIRDQFNNLFWGIDQRPIDKLPEEPLNNKCPVCQELFKNDSCILFPYEQCSHGYHNSCFCDDLVVCILCKTQRDSQKIRGSESGSKL